MDQKKLDNLPYIRSLTKRVDVGQKVLNLAKKHHKFILLYDKTPYVAPDKKIVENNIKIKFVWTDLLLGQHEISTQFCYIFILLLFLNNITPMLNYFCFQACFTCWEIQRDEQ